MWLTAEPHGQIHQNKLFSKLPIRFIACNNRFLSINKKTHALQRPFATIGELLTDRCYTQASKDKPDGFK